MGLSSFRVLFCCLSFLGFFLFCHSGNLDANGVNVCSSNISFTQMHQISVRRPIKVSYYTKCGSLNCTRHRTVYKTGFRKVIRTSYKKQYKCCKGWSQVGSQCTKAICTQPCVNGNCTKPDYCSCNSGYYGNKCKRDCPSHKWGPHCRHDCFCQNNAKCSPHTGTCTCTPGWKGQYCNKTCDQGYYGNKCQNNCTCLNGASCDPVSGNCKCAAGYQGQRCEKSCKDEIMGRKCQGLCACHNNATCSSDGFCNCTSGYTGVLCEKNCSLVTERCLTQCNCSQWGVCNPYAGLCICQPGYIGKTCHTQCPDGKYGPGCTGVCKCHNNATCHKIDGSCDCLPGWTGVECNNPCPAGYYGKNCQSKCICQNGASCDPVTGQCTCVGEWQGGFCNSSTRTNFDKKEHQNTDDLVLPIVISGVGFICVVGLIAVLVLTYRRKRGKKVMRKKSKGTNNVPEKGDFYYSNTSRNYESPSKRRRKHEKNSDKVLESKQDIQLQSHTYENFTAQKPYHSPAASTNCVAMDTRYHSNRGNLDNQDAFQPLDKKPTKKVRNNLKDFDSDFIDKNIPDDHERCHGNYRGFHSDHQRSHGNSQGFHDDVQPIQIKKKNGGDGAPIDPTYENLAFKSKSTSGFQSPALYGNVSRVLEITAFKEEDETCGDECPYEINQSEDTYVTFIS